MKTIAMAVLAVLAFTTAAPAQQACLTVNQIWTWKPLDRKTLVVEDTVHRKFKVSLYGPCPNIEYNLGAAFISRGNTQLDCLRPGDMVVHRGYGIGNRCPIKLVQPYTPAMQKADEATAATAKAQGNY